MLGRKAAALIVTVLTVVGFASALSGAYMTFPSSGVPTSGFNVDPGPPQIINWYDPPGQYEYDQARGLWLDATNKRALELDPDIFGDDGDYRLIDDDPASPTHGQNIGTGRYDGA